MAEQSGGASVAEASGPLILALADAAILASRSFDREAMVALAAHNLAVGMSRARMADIPTAHLAGDGSPGADAYRLAGRIYCRIQDDWYRGCHIGAVVLPAVLAIGVDDVMPAVAAGYAVNIALAEPYGLEALGRGLRPTSLFGPAAAAATAAIALGLDREGLAAAIAIALSTSWGNNQSLLEGTCEWQVQVLHAARTGVEAALIAANSLIASRFALEGPSGFLAMALNDGDGRRLRETLATHRAIDLTNVEIKPYPGSSFAAPAIGAALKAARYVGSEPVRRIVVKLTPAALSSPGASSKGPYPSEAAAVLSIPFCVAQAYATGVVRFGRRADAGTSELIQNIALEPSSAFGADRAAVDVETDSRTIRADHNRGASQRPTWLNTGADPDALADRCEAPRDSVRSICAALAAPRVPSSQLRALMDSRDEKAAEDICPI